jgi:hypothetical protein
MQFKIDNAFYINLDSSLSRRENCQKQFSSVGIPAIRWPGLDARVCTVTDVQKRLEEDAPDFLSVLDLKFKDADFCCLLSHVLLLKHIAKNNLKNTLIVEDDFCFVKQLESGSVPDGIDILYLTKRVFFNEEKPPFYCVEDIFHMEINDGCGFEGYWIPSAKAADNVLAVYLQDGIKTADLKVPKAISEGRLKGGVTKTRFIGHNDHEHGSDRKQRGGIAIKG